MYDPLTRVVATLQPDHSLIKAVFEPWVQTAFDVSDNVLVSNPKNDTEIGHFFEGLPQETYLPSWYDARIGGGKGLDEKAAAVKAASHADTPQPHHLDVLGHPILTIDDNGNRVTFPQKLPWIFEVTNVKWSTQWAEYPYDMATMSVKIVSMNHAWIPGKFGL